MKKCGTYCLVDKEKFRYKYENVLQELKDTGIIVITPSYVDEKFFPNSNESLFEYSKIIKKLCINRSNIKVVDLHLMASQEMEKGKWNDFYYSDHFHPNIFGYRKIGSAIAEKVSELIEENSK